MLGYAMHLNALTPTMQFLLCVAIVIWGGAEAQRLRHEGAGEAGGLCPRTQGRGQGAG